MYEAFYNLREKPFAILPDPGYLYFGERHTLAHTVLEYGVVEGAGFIVITGSVGCGKTTLIRRLLNRMHQEVTAGLISNTRQDMGELLRWGLLAFDQRTMPVTRIPDRERSGDMRSLNGCLTAPTNK